jgi:peptide/nickel transport system permease protein
MRRAGACILGALVLAAAAAPWVAPNPPDRRFGDHLYAPPTPIRFDGTSLYIHPLTLVSRLERRFEEQLDRRVPLQFFTGGRVLSVPEAEGPLLVLGADAFGRDIFSRLIHGARLSLLLAAVATALAVLLGVLIGGVAGYAGGVLDESLSRVNEFLFVLPAMYVALALRAVMPLVLPASTVFLMLVAILAVLGAPIVARGVRGIVASERTREYVMAGQALGAGWWRMLVRHVLPAARGHVGTQATLLLPAFVLAEATLSFVGLGFPDTVPTWGTMLIEASNVSMLADTPWVLAPAAAIFVVALAVNLLVQGAGRAPVQLK